MHLNERQINQSIIDIKWKDYLMWILKFIQRNDKDTIDSIMEWVLTCILWWLHVSTHNKSNKELDLQISALNCEKDMRKNEINVINRDRYDLNAQIIRKNEKITQLQFERNVLISTLIFELILILLIIFYTN